LVKKARSQGRSYAAQFCYDAERYIADLPKRPSQFVPILTICVNGSSVRDIAAASCEISRAPDRAHGRGFISAIRGRSSGLPACAAASRRIELGRRGDGGPQPRLCPLKGVAPTIERHTPKAPKRWAAAAGGPRRKT